LNVKFTAEDFGQTLSQLFVKTLRYCISILFPLSNP